MKSEEEFKNHLDELLNAKQFAFEEGEWTKMSAILDNAKRRRRAIYIWFTAGLIFLLGSTCLLIHSIYHSSDIALTEIKHANSATQKINSTEINSHNQNKTSNPAVSEIPVTAPIAKNETSADQQQSKQINTPAVKSPVTSQVKQNETSSSQNNTLTKSEPVQATFYGATQNIVQSTAKEIKAPAQQIPAQAAALPNVAVSENIRTDKKLGEPVKTIAANPVVPVAETPVNSTQAEATDHNSSTYNDKINIPETTNKPAGNTQPVNLQAPGTAVPVAQQPAAEIPPSTNKTEPQQNNPDAAVTENTLNANTPAAENTLAVTPESASMAAVAMKPDTDYVKRNQPRINFEGGADLMFGWKDADRRDALGINPSAGLNCTYKTGMDLELSIGLHYNMTGHLKYSQYTATVSRLDLGVNSKVTNFTPVRIHYLAVPVRIYRYANENTAYGIGLTGAYLLTVDSKVEQYSNNLAGQSGYTTRKDKGYTQGFNNFDMQVAFLLKQKLMRNFWAQGEFFYGLRDVKTGAYLKSDGFERNTGLRITVQYNLFSK